MRISGSHHVLKHPDGRTVPVPVHNRDMAKGTLRNILAIIGMTAESCATFYDQGSEWRLA